MGQINPDTGLAYQNKYGYAYGTKDYNRNSNLLKCYKITLVQWTQLFQQQGNVCKICSSSEPRGKNWHTDHCHVTGKIRGILCGWCNTGIGKLQESPEIFKKALEYLEAPIEMEEKYK